MTGARFDIAAAFRNKEVAMKAAFLAIRDVTDHGPTRGDVSEADWIGLMRDFLPTRYLVGPIFAVDHTGAMSEQIDVAIYDTHFSPQWFGAANGTRFVPVESVYAVFEVKPAFNSEYIRAARQKVASVRCLNRTSQSVAHKGGTYEKTDIQPAPIIGGILTTRCELQTDPIGKLQETQPGNHEARDFINIGICLDRFSFDYTPGVSVDGDVHVRLTVSPADHQLIHFVIRLFRQLQMIGSIPAVEMDMYEASIFSAEQPATEEE